MQFVSLYRYSERFSIYSIKSVNNTSNNCIEEKKLLSDVNYILQQQSGDEDQELAGPTTRRFSVDPQLTNFDILRNLIGRAFDMKRYVDLSQFTSQYELHLIKIICKLLNDNLTIYIRYYPAADARSSFK